MSIFQNLASLTNKLHQPDFLGEFTQFLRKLTDFDHLTTLAYFQDNRPILLHKFYTRDNTATSIEEYMQNVYFLDPVYSAHQHRIEEGCYRLEDLCPDRFKSTSYYKSYYHHTEIIDEIVFLTYSETGYTLALSLYRWGPEISHLSRKEFNDLKEISPMILALMKQHWNNFSDSHPHENEGGQDPLRERVRNAILSRENIEITDRQAEIIALTLRGHSATSIGLILNISPDTVKVHRRNIYSRLRISSQAELFSMVVAAIGPYMD